MTDEREGQDSFLLRASTTDSTLGEQINSSRTFRLTKKRVANLSLALLVFGVGFLVGSVMIAKVVRRRSDRRSTIDSSNLREQLFSSIDRNELRDLTGRSFESHVEPVNQIESSWKKPQRKIELVGRFNDQLTLSTMSKTNRWNGIELVDQRQPQLKRNFSCRSIDELVVLSNLVETGEILSKRIVFANYGRPEDFSLLIRRKVVVWNETEQTIVFLRRNEQIFPVIEQIRMINHYKFSGLVLFDDEQNRSDNEQNELDNLSIVSELDRLSSDQGLLVRQSQEKSMARFSFLCSIRERADLLDGSIEIDERQVPSLILSFNDVEQIFRFDENENETRIDSPRQWNIGDKSLPLVRSFEQVSLRLSVHFDEIPVVLSNLFGLIRGKEENEKFLLVSFSLADRNQERIVEQILRSFEATIQLGWRPRRSILFIGWSDRRFDLHSVRRWIEENTRSIDGRLIGLIDLNNEILNDSTLNIRGSALFEDLCRQSLKIVSSQLKLSSRKNESRTTVETIDRKNCVASIFHNELGVPSIVVETNDSISTEIFAPFVEFLIETIRRLIDDARLPFFVAPLADRIDRRSEQFLSAFGSKIDASSKKINSTWSQSKFRSTIEDLTRTIRRFDVRLEEKLRSNELYLGSLNEQLVRFEQLFRLDDQPDETKIFHWTNKNLLDGLSFHRSDRLVFLPRLNNILAEIDENSPKILHRILFDRLDQFEEKIHSIQRTLSALDSLFF